MKRLALLLLLLPALVEAQVSAFDAFSNNGSYTTSNISYSHTSSGTAECAIVFVSQAGTSAETISVTYGGAAMSHVTSSPYDIVGGGELDGFQHVFFLGTGVADGSQTVAVTKDGANNIRAFTITLEAGGDCEVIDTDASIDSASIANPSGTLSASGRTVFAAQMWNSGQTAVDSVEPPASWTERIEIDLGALTTGLDTFDTIGTSDVTFGATQTADDFQIFALLVAQVSSGGGAGIPLIMHHRRQQQL